MNGLFELKNPIDLFKKTEKDYEQFLNDPNDYDLFNLLTALNHLRDWILPEGYKSYKDKGPSEFTKEEKFHCQLFEDKNYRIIQALCNNSKHFKDKGIGSKTEILNGFYVDFNRCGDSLSQRNYVVDGQDLRDIIHSVFIIYKDYFN